MIRDPGPNRAWVENYLTQKTTPTYKNKSFELQMWLCISYIDWTKLSCKNCYKRLNEFRIGLRKR